MTNTKTNKTNQLTCTRDAFLIMKDLDMARAMDETEAVARLSAELKQSINLIFTGNAPEIRAIETVTVELAHREALAEDNERDARDWSTFLAQVAVTKTEEIETAHVEALAEDAKRNIDALLDANAKECDQYAEPAAATLCIGFDAELRAWFAFTLENSQVTASWELSAGSAAEAWTEAQQLNGIQE